MKEGGFDWNTVDTVLLDMDGTLLDRHFDNFFFEELLPTRYAALQGLAFKDAHTQLLGMYRSVERTLDWADLSYWTRVLGVDLVALTEEFSHLICYLPDAQEFLKFVRGREKRLYIITNAHDTNVRIKIAKTGLNRCVDRIMTGFEAGALKMCPEFWPACHRLLGFDPKRALFVDDDESCLAAAQQYGIEHLYHSSKSSSRLPPEPSARFPSIESFQNLMTS